MNRFWKDPRDGILDHLELSRGHARVETVVIAGATDGSWYLEEVLCDVEC